MKKLLTILLAAITMAVSACQHEEIWNELRDHEQRIEAIIDKCGQYDLPVVDLFMYPELDFSQGQDGVSTFTASAVNAHPWTNDGLHPNHLGHPAMGKLLVTDFNEIGIEVQSKI